MIKTCSVADASQASEGDLRHRSKRHNDAGAEAKRVASVVCADPEIATAHPHADVIGEIEIHSTAGIERELVR